MPNQNIRESKEAIQALKDVLGKILTPYTVYRCIVCERTQENKIDLIKHMVESHTLNEIFTIVDFDEAFRK